MFSRPELPPPLGKNCKRRATRLLTALSKDSPASTFKVVTATAGMESGKFPPNTVLNTFAALYVGGTAFGEWNHAGFGPIGFVRADGHE
jgi:cell division protein FtsI/penicillin-binding protein 2